MRETPSLEAQGQETLGAAAANLTPAAPAMRDKTSPRVNSLVTGGGLLLQQALGFIGGVFVAKMLGPAEYGQVSVLRTILTTVLVFSPLGLDLALFRILPQFDGNPARQALHFRRFRLIALGFGLATAVIGGLVAGPLLDGRVFAYPHFALNFGLTLIAVPFATDVLLMTAWYRVQGNIVPIMLITNYIQPVVRTLLNVLAIYLGYGVIGVVIGTGIAYLVAFAIAVPYHAWTLRSLPDDADPASAPRWPESVTLFREAPAMALNLFAYAVMRGADMTIVGALAPAHAVGEYAVVSNIAQLVPVAATSLTQTLGPEIARLHQAGDTVGIHRALNHTIRWASLLSSFVFGGIAGFGVHLDAVFGHAYQPAPLITGLIPLGYLMSAILAPTSYGLTMCRRSRIDLGCIVAAAVVLITLGIPLTYAFGTVGAAVAVLVAFMVINALRVVAIHHTLGIWVGTPADALPPVVAVILAMGLNRLLLPENARLVPLLGACAVYTLVYCTIMFGNSARQWLAGRRLRKAPA